MNPCRQTLLLLFWLAAAFASCGAVAQAPVLPAFRTAYALPNGSRSNLSFAPSSVAGGQFKGHLTTRFADCLVDHDVVVLQDGNLFVVRMTRLKAVNTTKFSEVAWCAGVAVTLRFPNTATGTGTIEFAAGGEELGGAQFSY